MGVQEGVSWDCIERLQVLSAAQQSLPAGFTEDLLSRRVMEEFSAGHAAQELKAAAHAYPATFTQVLQPSGDRVVVCCAAAADGVVDGKDTGEQGTSLPACATFGAYLDQCIGADGVATPRQLPAVSYPITAADAAMAKRSKCAVVSEAAWLHSDATGLTMQSTDGPAVAFRPHGGTPVVLHGKLGLHAGVNSSKMPSQMAPEQDGHAVEEGNTARNAAQVRTSTGLVNIWCHNCSGCRVIGVS